ncbi:AAA 11 domain containing protein, partial [Asbolus verrucosus]
MKIIRRATPRGEDHKKGGFYEYLKANVSDDAIILFTKILRKVCDSSFHENKFKILQMYCDVFFDGILTNYISSLPVQSESQRGRNKYFWKDTDDFWNNVIKICENILASIPTFAMKVLPAILKSLHVYIPVFETQHSQHISDEIKENVKRLLDIVQTMLKGNEEKEKAQIKQKLLNEDEEEPPDDFRQISVYPSTHELIGNNRTYLRQNVIRGPYRSVDHYLDVQFRLLREDFVGPLRCGIANYKSESKKRIKNVKIHKKVRFLNPETINESYCIRVQFDFTKKKNTFNFENSRRFMFGSLLCFTADNFKTFVFDYIMIECSVYFEPYYSVLSVLKNMTVENFPMEKYIIYVDPSVRPPKYLSVDEVSYSIEGLEFSPLLNWPNRNFYNLNESQLIAFRAALTQEFTIIQGPPGTGKTFLGLKIAKTLLENKDIWYKKTPMLVICFTNHVLDQFLEGILSFTNSIMRVGGQSKNVKLQSYNLRNKIRYKVNPAISQQGDQVKRILQIEYYHSVRAFDIFEDVVPNFSATWFHRATKYEILSWLLDEGENVLAPELEIYQNGTRVEEQLNEKVHDKESESGESDVVGMTTTGAARLRSTLQTLKSPIVIVEEAAEVLEAHIITSLTKHCEQLVLIGDHQQLKPSTTDYDIEKRYNLGISLFERMILNNIQCYTLNVQYRMRPEIAHLIHPTIYTSLEDHPSVAERPAIMGVDNDLFFIDHTNAEMDCEGTSKKNYHEVGFLISFARHLILNGYKPEQITILTAYLGQMVCVALSRARNGLYVIGNMTQLCNASELWRKIKRTFEEQNAIGPELPLRCQVHTETVTYVKNSSDFLNIPEGGCNQICGANLVCGHTCTSFCHILDKHHENYKCRATCGRKLCDNDEKHVCKKMCYEKCGPCTYFVERTLPCGHVVNLECHLDPDTYDCVVPVSTRLSCGHTTDKPCHADSSTYRCPHPCESMVEPCGHACLMKCHIRKDPDHLE